MDGKRVQSSCRHRTFRTTVTGYLRRGTGLIADWGPIADRRLPSEHPENTRSLIVEKPTIGRVVHFVLGKIFGVWAGAHRPAFVVYIDEDPDDKPAFVVYINENPADRRIGVQVFLAA